MHLKNDWIDDETREIESELKRELIPSWKREALRYSIMSIGLTILLINSLSINNIHAYDDRKREGYGEKWVDRDGYHHTDAHPNHWRAEYERNVAERGMDYRQTYDRDR